MSIQNNTLRTQEDVKELLRTDPFLKLWEDNYTKNYLNGTFGSTKARPLMFLVNTFQYQKLPVLLIAAGPSLDRNIKRIKEFENHFIIVCADVALFKLVEYGIKPDFVVNIDPHESISRFWRDFDTTDLCLVCPTTINPKALEKWNGKIFFFNQADKAGEPKGEILKRITKVFKGWGSIYNQYFIGATMLQFSKVLSPAKILLAGYDFGFTDNKAYCDGLLDIKIYLTGVPEGSAEYNEWMAKTKAAEVKKEVQAKLSTGQDIWTSNTLLFYKDQFRRLIQSLKLPVVNCTEGGILVEIPRMSIERAVLEYCRTPIQRKDVFELPKRKRKKR
jgi:hypothetical protein